MLTPEAIKYLEDRKLRTLEHDGAALVVLPENDSIESLERFQTRPDAIRQTVRLLSLESLRDYVTRFKSTSTVLYLSTTQFTAVLDHSIPDLPAWNRHVAHYEPLHSLEWKAWTTIADEKLSQRDLIRFIERRHGDAVSPTPAGLLAAAVNFEVTEKHVYQAVQDLNNGNVQVTYVKDGSPKRVEFPHQILLKIPVFENDAPVELSVRLRYRTQEGAIHFVFEFVDDPDAVVRERLLGMAESLRAALDVPTFEGRIEVAPKAGG